MDGEKIFCFYQISSDGAICVHVCIYTYMSIYIYTHIHIERRALLCLN